MARPVICFAPAFLADERPQGTVALEVRLDTPFASQLLGPALERALVLDHVVFRDVGQRVGVSECLRALLAFELDLVEDPELEARHVGGLGLEGLSAVGAQGVVDPVERNALRTIHLVALVTALGLHADEQADRAHKVLINSFHGRVRVQLQDELRFVQAGHDGRGHLFV